MVKFILFMYSYYTFPLKHIYPIQLIKYTWGQEVRIKRIAMHGKII